MFSTAGSDVVAISMAAISLPRQLPTSSCEVLTVSAMLHEMVAEQTRQLGARHEDTLQTKEELATLLGADAKEHRAAHALLAEVVAAQVR